MRKLLLVGDKPSKKNKDPLIAFVGTASHKRIKEWLEILLEEKTAVSLINRVDPDFSTTLIQASLKHYKIIALGQEASFALINHGITNHFKLPHPSGRNRQLNDKQFVADILQKCKTWIEQD